MRRLDLASSVWAAAVGISLWLGGIAIGVAKGTAFLIAVLAGLALVLFVRLYGDRGPRRP